MKVNPLHKVRARLGYAVARRMFHWRWCVSKPRVWNWMQGQYARLAAQGDLSAQSFYGHVLLFRGQGSAARHEGVRLLRLAADRGEVKAAYQLGQFYFKGDLQQPADIGETVRWWRVSAEGGHPLAAKRLAELYRQGAAGLPANPAEARVFADQARVLGL